MSAEVAWFEGCCHTLLRVISAVHKIDCNKLRPTTRFEGVRFHSDHRVVVGKGHVMSENLQMPAKVL